MIKISLLGYGNLGRHLAHHLCNLEGVELCQIYSPSQKTQASKNYEIVNDLAALKYADLFIAAVSDDALTELCEKLPAEFCVVHTSGTVGMDALASHSKRGVFYPLQSFSKEHSVSFDEIPLCLEANNPETMALLEEIAGKLSNKVMHISSEQRLKLHLGAVLVNNFTNHLYALSKMYLEQKGLPFDLLHPLMEETTKKAIAIGPESAQTGPAKRGDLATINRHLTLLEEGQLKEIYNLLSDSIKEHSKSSHIGNEL